MRRTSQEEKGIRVLSCTVIVPARDAAATIADTLDSIAAQTRRDWRAVIVDDGSTDATADIVRRYVDTDPRFGLLPGPTCGPGAARNVGIVAAPSPYVAFLDADDLLDATYLARMLDPLEEDPSATASYCGWRRLAPDGATENGPCPQIDGDLFEDFAAACVFPPHACVVRVDALRSIGGFDERPTTTEDWDLWQRLARTGARFVRVDETLVTYRMRQHSRSRNHLRVLHDGLRVIATGHAGDPRVARPHPAHASGRNRALLGQHSFGHACWAAGMAIAAGEDGTTVFTALAPLAAPDLDEWVVAGTLLEAMRVTACASRAGGVATVMPLASQVLRFLVQLERAAAATGLAARAATAIDALLLEQSIVQRPATLLRTRVDRVELTEPLPERLELAPPVTRWRGELSFQRVPVGMLSLPVAAPQLSREVMADAIAEAHHWEILKRFLAATVVPTLEISRREAFAVVRRHGQLLAPDVAGEGESFLDALHHAAGWHLFLQELLGDPALTMGTLYGGGLPASAPERNSTDDAIRFDLCDARFDVTTTAKQLEVSGTLCGFPIGTWTATVHDGRLAAGQLVRQAVEADPTMLLRVAVREGIVGVPLDDAAPLRTRLERRYASNARHRG